MDIKETPIIPLENNLEETLDDIMSKENVNGVMLVDDQGLTCGVRGVLKSGASGNVESLYSLSSKLSNSNNISIIVETDQTQILISRKNGYTTAISKKN